MATFAFKANVEITAKTQTEAVGIFDTMRESCLPSEKGVTIFNLTSCKEAQHVVIQGNPVDGFTIIGPFDERQDATDYVDSETYSENCWATVLYAPASDKG